MCEGRSELKESERYTLAERSKLIITITPAFAAEPIVQFWKDTKIKASDPVTS